MIVFHDINWGSEEKSRARGLVHVIYQHDLFFTGWGRVWSCGDIKDFFSFLIVMALELGLADQVCLKLETTREGNRPIY